MGVGVGDEGDPSSGFVCFREGQSQNSSLCAFHRHSQGSFVLPFLLTCPGKWKSKREFALCNSPFFRWFVIELQGEEFRLYLQGVLFLILPVNSVTLDTSLSLSVPSKC